MNFLKGLQLPERLKSRKFWVALVSAALFVLQGHSNEAMAVILTYLGVQGAVDFKGNG